MAKDLADMQGWKKENKFKYSGSSDYNKDVSELRVILGIRLVRCSHTPQQKIEWLENCHESKYLWTLEEAISYLEEYEDRFRVVSKDNY